MAIYPKDFFDENKITIKPRYCFVLMPFGGDFDELYDEVIKEVFEANNFSISRADKLYGSQPIMEDILKNIESAEIILADLTGKNPNVLYELGIAHTRKSKENVIIITQDMDHVPFDLRPYRVIVYKLSISGAKKLKKRLDETLKQIRLKCFKWSGYQWCPVTPEWFVSENLLRASIEHHDQIAMIFNNTLTLGPKFRMIFNVKTTAPEANVMLFSDGRERFSGYHLWLWSGGVKLSRLEDIKAETFDYRLRYNHLHKIEIRYYEGAITVEVDNSEALSFVDNTPLHNLKGLGYMGFNVFGGGGVVEIRDFKVEDIK